MVDYVISSGRRGVEAAALEVAERHNIMWGGWSDNINEVEAILRHEVAMHGFGVKQVAGPLSAQECNVMDSDLVLVLAPIAMWQKEGLFFGKTDLAEFYLQDIISAAEHAGRPWLGVNLSCPGIAEGREDEIEAVREELTSVDHLLVTGPSEEKWPRIHDVVFDIMPMLVG